MNYLLWRFFKRLANLNLAISILFFIATSSILGSVIEQDQSLSYYQAYYPIDSYNMLNFNWKLIYYLGLDHLYQTWWFICLLLLLSTSLLVCTFSTQLPSLKNARRWKFISSSITKDSNYSLLDDVSISSYTNMIYSLVFSNFFVFHQKKSIYSYKGLYGRIAPIFVHFSMIIIFIGSMLGSLSGFVSQEMVPKGEIFHLKNITHTGYYNILPVDLIGNVENFYITYNPDSSIKQFFSKISLIYKGFSKSSLISVNTPLLFKGLTLYQTDWQINALRIRLGPNIFIQKQLIQTNFSNRNCWICKLSLTSSKQIFLVVFNLNDLVAVCDSNGIVLNTVKINDLFYLNNVLFSIQDIMVSSGLQVKFDPGILLVYLGFFVVMLSTLLSYISYSQIWVYMSANFCKFIGSTNRATLFFEKDISCINRTYHSYTFNFNNQSYNFNTLVSKILV
uniref:Cytochrome c biogenesis protein Ccs1 n=1 Tax=Dasyclonium flaccidum TaxID=2007274 RepID=A0A1Z1ML91_9FLOR|nr:cytochrome c biogenesis protein ccs1 [Dasyclonium flaccidum]ARW66555.1 cytochrome c biogenesis protein ccs1 [Dasyclonium flaccidum]